jgi:polysaccharide biosynthesis/export protein
MARGIEVKMRKRRGAVACCLLIMLAGCAGQTLKAGPGITRVNSTELPMPDRSDLTWTDRPYYVGPFDELMIDVYGIEEMSKRTVQVDASGRIAFPLVGTIEAGGKTPGEISALIEDGLRRRYIRDPQVTINLQKTVSQVVTVEGEVKEPGLYPIIGRTSLLRAVASAKGTTEYSKLDDVVIFRTVQGKRYAALYNLKAIRNGAYPDPEVFANDVVMVGESRGRRIFRDILQVVPLLTYPIIVALQN